MGRGKVAGESLLFLSFAWTMDTLRDAGTQRSTACACVGLRRRLQPKRARHGRNRSIEMLCNAVHAPNLTSCWTAAWSTSPRLLSALLRVAPLSLRVTAGSPHQPRPRRAHDRAPRSRSPRSGSRQPPDRFGLGAAGRSGQRTAAISRSGCCRTKVLS